MDKDRQSPPPSVKPNWQPFERRPTWSVVSSRELSEVLGVSLQTICNWRLRGKLPDPVSDPGLKGNRNYYRISAIRSWLENKTEKEIHLEWANHFMNVGTPYQSLEQAAKAATLCWDIFEIEKPAINF